MGYLLLQRVLAPLWPELSSTGRKLVILGLVTMVVATLMLPSGWFGLP